MGKGDGRPTKHGLSRVFSSDNLAQWSTRVGGVAAAVGVVLANQPSLWAQIAGQALIAAGSGAVAHDSAPR